MSYAHPRFKLYFWGGFHTFCGIPHKIVIEHGGLGLYPLFFVLPRKDNSHGLVS